MTCAKCGSDGADKKCGKCCAVSYCSRDCQREHWKSHKKECSTMAKQRQKDEDEGRAPTRRSEPPAPRAPTLLDPVPTPPPAPAPAPPAVAPPGKPLTSTPFIPPPNLSDKGKELVKELKPILENPPDAVHVSIADTVFCDIVDDRQRVNTKVVFCLHQLLEETLKADPDSTPEVFKRVIAIKLFLKQPDDAMYVHWASIIGQHCLASAQRLRLSALAAMGQEQAAQGAAFPAHVSAKIASMRAHASAFLHLGLQFLPGATAVQRGAQVPMPREAAKSLRGGLSTVIGYALRHTPGTEAQRQAYWKKVVEASGENKLDPLSRALSAYGLAFDACAANDEEAWEKYLDMSLHAWKEVDDRRMLEFLQRHRARGCCRECCAEMAGVMDGNEVKFGRSTVGDASRAVAATAMSDTTSLVRQAGDADDDVKGSGAKLVAGGRGSGAGRGNGAGRGAAAGTEQRSAPPAAGRGARPPPDPGLKELEAEMKRGYELYAAGDLEGGIELFSKLIKKGFDMPVTGMSISVLFGMSHAHIEACAQVRRWGKAENTVSKLRELAEYSEKNAIPYAIDTVSHRLHLWWREKQANLYSRQKMYLKAAETLEPALPHADAICKRMQAAVYMLIATSHIELHLAGSAKADLSAMQRYLDRGVDALRADPPPIGAGASAKEAANTWRQEAKLEQWIKLIPMLRALESEGVAIDKAESVLLPLADRFDMDVGPTLLNAHEFLQGALTQRASRWGRLGQINSTTVLFALAVLLPLALAVWLAIVAMSAEDPEDALLSEEDVGAD